MLDLYTLILCYNFFQVYFVDYGNTCGVHRNNIRLLRYNFFLLLHNDYINDFIGLNVVS